MDNYYNQTSTGKLYPERRIEESFNKFVKDQIRRSSEEIKYSITVEEGAFETMIKAIEDGPTIKPLL